MNIKQKLAQIELSKVLIVLAICVMSLTFVFAGITINASNDKTSYNESTQTFSIKNKLEIQLLTPLDYHRGAGYTDIAQYRVNSKKALKVLLKDLELYDKKDNMKSINRTIDIKFKSLEQVEINDYETSCIDAINESTGNMTKQCTQNLVESHFEEKNTWTLLEDKNNFDKNEEIIIGLFTTVLIDDKVEWIPIFQLDDKDDFRVKQWATWTEDLLTGLVEFYDFDETSGTSLIDIHSTYNGTSYGTAVFNQTSFMGTTWNFSAANYVKIPYNADLLVNDDKTIMFWQKMKQDSTHWSALGNWVDAGNDGYSFFLSTTGLSYSQVGAGKVSVTNQTISYETWYHVAVTTGVNGADIKLYLNGVELDPNTNTVVGAGNNEGVGDQTYVGRTNYGSGYLEGQMDNLGLWTRELSPEEILYAYDSQVAGYGYNDDSCFSNPTTITANVTSPTLVYTNTDWLINITATDVTNSTFSAYTKFYVNDSNVTQELFFNLTNNTNSLIATLANANFSGGNTLIAEVWVGNTESNSTKVNYTTTVQYFNITGTLKDGNGNNVNGSIIINNESDNSFVANVTSINGVWTYGPVLPGKYAIEGYNQTDTVDGDSAPHVVVP